MKANRSYLCAVILYVLLLIAIVALADLGVAEWLFAASTLMPFGDKICHLILMGLFSFLLNSAMRCRTVSLAGVRFLVGSLTVSALVVTEEMSQFWLASRNVEAYDLLFDFVGIYSFGRLAVLNLRMGAKRTDA